ncbi:sensor histidine kinase [Embleya hyalina]|uniref:histidine kinase n=1 Tax=Embleya hyalina TaxID=516124 RepID=A0A401YHV1_9ACTN|nr:histidine kinase [Embleya hyalina]GCD94149.1 histidine kinase [Embleya hyalina]
MDGTTQPGESPSSGEIKGFSVPAGFVGLRRALALCWMSIAALGRSLAVSGAITLVGPGLGMVPRAMEGVRALSNRRRALAARWSGVRIPAPAGRRPPVPAGASGVVARYRWIMNDPQMRREFVWVLSDPVAGAFLAFFPIALLLGSAWGIFLAFFGVSLSEEWDGLWYYFIPIGGSATAVFAGVLGVLHLPLALWVAPRAVRKHALYTHAMLAPSENEMMAGRIEHLATTRSDAADTQMAEIRRIERDLHDGAQARLVAMGMNLDTAERLLETNPEAVRALLIEARQSSAKALQELRNLVRGIHPPVLADRGLVDAVRSLAMVCPVPTEVTVDLPGRPEMPIESAAYFAISEILTNVAKHSNADRAWIDVRYDHGMLRVTITDTGHGGADAARGTGLRGVERRLATFDGVLAVNSPVNGPTMVTMELPCELSSPKTTSSLGTD